MNINRHWPGTRRLAEGVIGAGYENAGAFILETIEAERQGSGAVGRYLDDLKVRHHTVIVLAVLSPRLGGMLKRRGFVDLDHDNWIWRSPLAPPPPTERLKHHPSLPRR